MAIDTITVSLPQPTPLPHSPSKANPLAKRVKHSNQFNLLVARGLGDL